MAARKPKNGGVTVLADSVEMVLMDSIQPHPKNVRQGDIGAICQSIQVNGFYRSLIVQRSTRNILAGNHTWYAARQVGMLEVPVTWIDCDDDRALRILLVDNRSNDLASYDDSALAELLQGIQSESGTLLGTGYDGDALDQLLADLAAGGASPDEPAESDATVSVQCPACGHTFTP